MAGLVSRPDVVEFIDFLTNQTRDTVNLEEIEITPLSHNWENKTLVDVLRQNKGGATIIGLKNLKGEYIANPSVRTKVEHKLKLFVLGNQDQISALKDLLELRSN